MTEAETIERLSTLFQPIGGICETVAKIPATSLHSEPYAMYTATVGDVGFVAPGTMGATPRDVESDSIGGAGSDVEEGKAKIRALAESVERYANFIFLRDEVITATATSLGDNALDLNTLPKCSDAEYADLRAPVRRPNPDQPIRWVPALSMKDGSTKYVPLVCTHLVRRPWESEYFTNPISTGVAAHFSRERAILSAICEVVERDAIASIWLARLPIPRFEPPAGKLREWGMRDDSALKSLFFDATFDCGVRTVYHLQLCDHHPTAAQIVGCATDVSLEKACQKVVRETLCYRTKFEQELAIPDKVEDFIRLQDGAVYMGRPEHRSAFDFLEQQPVEDIPLGADPDLSDAEHLKRVREAILALGMDIYLVDMTTDELREVGLWVIRAVIPQLMPMSPVYRARFLGTPRLYELARKSGRPDFEIGDVNPYPQPFA